MVGVEYDAEAETVGYKTVGFGTEDEERGRLWLFEYDPSEVSFEEGRDEELLLPPNKDRKYDAMIAMLEKLSKITARIGMRTVLLYEERMSKFGP